MKISIKNINQHLQLNAKGNVKTTILENVLIPLTGLDSGRDELLRHPDLLRQLVALTQDSSTAIVKNTCLALVNLTGEAEGATAFLSIAESQPKAGLKYNYNLIHISIRSIMDKESILADPCCMILSNMTRPQHTVDRVLRLIETSGYTLDDIIAAFTAKQYNNVGGKLNYLASVFGNLCQSPRMRRYLMNKDRKVIQRLLPYTEYSASPARRFGIFATIKNCCFDVENHEWLLSPEIDILSYLLLPLAGPEEFDDEDNDKLPISLQYLPETKQREQDADLRVMLLETLTQLCATRKGREILRAQNTYIILREYHKWEKNKVALLICENVVNILIRTEEEIGLDNLKNVKVPSKYTETFDKMNQDFINSSIE